VGLGLIGKEPMHSQGEIQQHKGQKKCLKCQTKELTKFSIKLIFTHCTRLK